LGAAMQDFMARQQAYWPAAHWTMLNATDS
jgi:hypothetical protein